MDALQMNHWILGTKYVDKQKGKTYPGKTKVYTLGEDKLRMEVYDPFGFMTIGLLVINKDQMYLKLINGEEYRGSVQEKKIKDFLKVEINPKDLVSIFTQQGFEDKHWSCSVGDQNVLQECYSGVHGIKINWLGSMSQKGTSVVLDHEKSKITFVVKSFRSSDQYSEKSFNPNVL